MSTGAILSLLVLLALVVTLALIVRSGIARGSIRRDPAGGHRTRFGRKYLDGNH